MSDTFKDFDAAIRERRREPLCFRLGGEDFEATPHLAIGIVMAAGAKPLRGAADLVGFVREVLASDDNRSRFDALVQRRDVEVDVYAINEVVDWLLECQTTRPPEPRSDSPESRLPTTDTSKDGSRKRASTPPPSSASPLGTS